VKLHRDGVCDFSKPGVDRVRTVDWQSYQDDEGRVVYGGRPLGAPPASEPFGPGSGGRRACVSRRRIVIHARGPRGRKVRSVRLYLNGRRVRGGKRRVHVRVRGRRLRARLDLRGLRRGKVRVRIVARTRGGRKVVVVRRFRTCARR
jgi:hypothetical protein